MRKWSLQRFRNIYNGRKWWWFVLHVHKSVRDTQIRAGFAYHSWYHPIFLSAQPVNSSISFSFCTPDVKSLPDLAWPHSWNTQKLQNSRHTPILIGQVCHRIGVVKYKNYFRILGCKSLDQDCDKCFKTLNSKNNIQTESRSRFFPPCRFGLLVNLQPQICISERTPNLTRTHFFLHFYGIICTFSKLCTILCCEFQLFYDS